MGIQRAVLSPLHAKAVSNTTGSHSLIHAHRPPRSTIALREMRCDLEYSWAYFFMHDGIFTTVRLSRSASHSAPKILTSTPL